MSKPVKLAEKPRPNLGVRGTFNHILRRRRRGSMRDWGEQPVHPQTGMYIGYRLLQNGDMDAEWNENDYYTYFLPSSYVEAWLFVIGPRQKPVYVLPEHVVMEAKGES